MDTPLEARILRVADIVQALVQDRPYRAGMNEPQLREVLEDLLAKGKLDSSITQQVLQNLPAAMAVARARTA
jgi:HD-GYP domain-containing protein (c-di-GMP phosphodiesterase class II)